MHIFTKIYNRLFSKKTARVIPIHGQCGEILSIIIEETSEDVIDPDLDNNPMCPICIDPICVNKMCVTQCNHHFHIECLTPAISQNKKCPMCRAYIHSYILNGKSIEVNPATENASSSSPMPTLNNPPSHINSAYYWFTRRFTPNVFDSFENVKTKTYNSIKNSMFYKITRETMHYLYSHSAIFIILSEIINLLFILAMLYATIIFYMIIGIIYYTLVCVFCIIDVMNPFVDNLSFMHR